MQLPRRKPHDHEPLGPTPNVTFEVTRGGTGVRVNAFRIGFMGAIGVLVLSGESTRADATAADPPPDMVIEHVGELAAHLERAR